jgi:hypothetical protein
MSIPRGRNKKQQSLLLTFMTKWYIAETSRHDKVVSCMFRTAGRPSAGTADVDAISIQKEKKGKYTWGA